MEQKQKTSLININIDDQIINDKFNSFFIESNNKEHIDFFKNNSIILRSNLIWDLILLMEHMNEDQQINLLDKLIFILQKINLNSTEIVQKTEIQQPNNKNKNLIEHLIQLSINKYKHESQSFTSLFNLLSILLMNNQLKKNQVNVIFKLMGQDFYNNKIQLERIYASIKLLQNIFQIQKVISESVESQNYFYFLGSNSSLKLNTQKQIQWEFKDGICLIIWIFLEKIEESKDNTQILFTIKCKEGGIEAYFSDYILYYRTLGNELYQKPKKETRALTIMQLQPNTWNYVVFNHDGPKIMKKSMLNVYINSSSMSYSLQFPKIPSNSLIEKYQFGENLCGKISSIIIYKGQLEIEKLKKIFTLFQFGIQNYNGIKYIQDIIQDNNNLLHLITPIRSCNYVIIYLSDNNINIDMINNTILYFEDHVGYLKKQINDKNLNFFGGFKIFLPFFYFTRFCPIESNIDIISELFKLLIILFDKQLENQKLACEINFFQIAGNLLSELSYPCIQLHHIDILYQLYGYLQYSPLIIDFFNYILWGENIMDLMQSYTVSQQFLKLIKQIYNKNQQILNKFLSVEQIIFKAQIQQDFFLNDQKLQTIIREFLSLIIEKINYKQFDKDQDIKSLVDSLINKQIPSYHLELLNLLEQIIYLEKNNQNQLYMIQKMIEEKIIENLFYLFKNTTSFDIKNNCLQIMDLIITLKNPSIKTFDFSSYLAYLISEIKDNQILNVDYINPQNHFKIVQYKMIPSFQQKKKSFKQSQNEQNNKIIEDPQNNITQKDIFDKIDSIKKEMNQLNEDIKIEDFEDIKIEDIIPVSSQLNEQKNDLKNLYLSVMNWIVFIDLQNGKVIQIIQNTLYFDIIMAIYQVSEQLRKQILEDLEILLNLNNDNSKNIIKISNETEFNYWILDITLEQFIKLKIFQNDIDLQLQKTSLQILKNLIIYNITVQINGILLIKNILLWFYTKKSIFDNTVYEQIYRQYKYEYLLHFFNEIMIEIYKESILKTRSNCDTFIQWKNILQLTSIIFEIIIKAHESETQKNDTIQQINHLCISQLEEKLISQQLYILEPLINIGNVFQQIIENGHEIDAQMQEIMTRQINYFFDYEKQTSLLIFYHIIYICKFYIDININDFAKVQYAIDLLVRLLNQTIFICEYTSDEQFFLSIIESSNDSNEFLYQLRIQSAYCYILKYFYDNFLQQNENSMLFLNGIKQILQFSIQNIRYIEKIYDQFDYFTNDRQKIQVKIKQGKKQQVNFILNELFYCYILDQDHNNIINSISINQQIQNNFQYLEDLILDSKFIYAFCQSRNMLQLIDRFFLQSFEQIKKKIYSIYSKQSKINYESLKMNDDNKEIIINKLESQIICNSKKVLEQGDINKKKYYVQKENQIRLARNKWKKIWKELRSYNGQYRHEQFYDQNDTVYDSNIENQQQKMNINIFTHKMANHITKSKARPFLKIKLIEPKIEQICTEKLNDKYKSNLESQKLNLFNQSQIDQKFLDQISQKVDDSLIQKINKTFQIIYSPIKQISNKENKKQNQQQFVNQENHLIFDSIIYSAPVQWIKTLTIRYGKLYLSQSNLYFCFDQILNKQSNISICNYVLPYNRKLQKVWNLKNLKHIQIKNYLLRNTALEIYLMDGQSVLFNFDNQNQNQILAEKLMELRKESCINLKKYKTFEPKKIFENQILQKKWQMKKISNFEYLMQLNFLSGRSYKDIMQYPVMPWILINYSSDSIDINDHKNYRNLRYNVGSLGSDETIQCYFDRYNTLVNSECGMPPFHFGSYYSSSAIIFQFLIRTQPFTEGAKILQNGKYDIADRLFSSIKDSFNCVIEDISDVRELPPDFYSFPEMYINKDKIKFGTMQNGHKVDNIVLPKWANNNPYLFVYYMRKAMESQYVTNNIQNWIDLIFGYKQRGDEAMKAMNVYYYLTYDDQINLDDIEDEQQKYAIETQIANFGQTPIQLSTKPHPIAKNYENYLIINTDNIQVFKPAQKNKSFPIDKKIFINIITMDYQYVIKLRQISEDRIFSLKKNGEIVYYKFWQTPQNQIQNTVILRSNQKEFIPFQFAVEKVKNIDLQKCPDIFISLFDQTLNLTEYPIEFLNKFKIAVIGGFYDGRLQFINIDQNECTHIIYEHHHTVSVIKSDVKNTFLYTGTIEGDVIMWKIDQNSFQIEKIKHYYDHTSIVISISINEDLKIFATGSHDFTVNIYNKFSGAYMRTIFHPNNQPITNILLVSNPVAALVLYSNLDSELFCYSINGQIIDKKILPNKFIFDLQQTKDNDFSDVLIYGTELGNIVIRELPFLNIKTSPSLGQQQQAISILMHDNGKYIFCGNHNGDVAILTDLTIHSTYQNQEI